MLTSFVYKNHQIVNSLSCPQSNLVATSQTVFTTITMHPSIHQPRSNCYMLFFLGIFLILPNTTEGIRYQLDNCTSPYDWRCDYWKTDKVCPYSNDWDCFIYFYTSTCPSGDYRCQQSDTFYDSKRGSYDKAYQCWDYEDYCTRYAECSNYIKPKDCCTEPLEPFFFFGCYCRYLDKVSIMLNNGVRNYTITHDLPKWDGLQTFEVISKYTVPKIDCIDEEGPPFILTIQDFCLSCNYEGSNTSYIISLTSRSDGTVQTRGVPNLDLIKRPKRWTSDYNDCISETYELEKSSSYGSGVIQISKPGTYTWSLKVNTTKGRAFKNYDLKYDFKINRYCNSISDSPTQAPTQNPTGVPTKAPTGAPVVPKKTMSISLYHELKTNVWKEIIKSSADKIENVCINRDMRVSIQAYPDETEFGVPTYVTFELIGPNNSSFKRREVTKPYFLYGNIRKSIVWYGRKWSLPGIYTIKITPKYAIAAAATTFVKTINVTKVGGCVGV